MQDIEIERRRRAAEMPDDELEPEDSAEVPYDETLDGELPRSYARWLLIAILLAAMALVAFVVRDRLGDDQPVGDPNGGTEEGTDVPTLQSAEELEVSVPDEAAGDGGTEAETSGDPSTDDSDVGTTGDGSDASSTAVAPAGSADAPISVVGMSSLSNVRLRTNRAAYRFTAEQTGDIEAMRLYFIVNTSRPGYAGGTGGAVDVTVAPDDGTGFPDETQLLPGRFTATFGLNAGAPTSGDRGDFIKNTLLGRWEFSEPLQVDEGETYHIIFTNADPSPATNFVSLDLVIDLLANTDTSGQPLPSPARRTDIGFLEDRAGRPWFKADTHSSGHWRTPIFQVEYAGGYTQGQGFMQYEASDAFTLEGSSAIRTTIVLAEDRTVSQLAARVSHHPTAPVILELTTIDGEVLRSVTAPASATQNYRGASWAEGTVEPLTLEAGTEYALVVRPGSGYTGTVIPLQAGLAYGYTPASVFPFGRAQISSDGRNWSDWRAGLFFQSISVK